MPIPLSRRLLPDRDPRTGEPRDLGEQKNSEAALRNLNESLEGRVTQRILELARTNERLIAERLKRAQADRRFQKLQE